MFIKVNDDMNLKKITSSSLYKTVKIATGQFHFEANAKLNKNESCIK